VAPGPVWTCTKNLATYRISSPDRPARTQSRYRLSYTAIVCVCVYIYIYIFAVRTVHFGMKLCNEQRNVQDFNLYPANVENMVSS
jgi:hypothetical protein